MKLYSSVLVSAWAGRRKTRVDLGWIAFQLERSGEGRVEWFGRGAGTGRGQRQPLAPEPAPPEPTVVPPGPPPVVKVEVEPPSVPVTRPGGRAQRRCAGACAQNVGVGNVQIVAGNGDVVVVLDGQGERIRQAQIDLAILQQVASRTEFSKLAFPIAVGAYILHGAPRKFA